MYFESKILASNRVAQGVIESSDRNLWLNLSVFLNEEHPQENRGGQITKKPLLPEAQGMPLLVFAVRPIWRQRSIFSDWSCLNCLLAAATIKNCILYYLKQDWDPEGLCLAFVSSCSSSLCYIALLHFFTIFTQPSLTTHSTERVQESESLKYKIHE